MKTIIGFKEFIQRVELSCKAAEERDRNFSKAVNVRKRLNKIDKATAQEMYREEWMIKQIKNMLRVFKIDYSR